MIFTVNANFYKSNQKNYPFSETMQIFLNNVFNTPQNEEYLRI